MYSITTENGIGIDIEGNHRLLAKEDGEKEYRYVCASDLYAGFNLALVAPNGKGQIKAIKDKVKSIAKINQ